MNHKERVLKTLLREPVDRVPFFYWGVPEFTDKMAKHLGLADRDQLMDYLDVDFRWVEPVYVGPPLIDPSGKKKERYLGCRIYKSG